MVNNCAALKAQVAAATAQGRMWLPRVLGRLEQSAAVGERPLEAGPAGWRALPQVASPDHWAREFDRAAQQQAEALPLVDTAARRPTTHQYIGKRRSGQRDGSGAPVEIETAFRVRARAGTARILSVSSARAAHRAPERVGR